MNAIEMLGKTVRRLDGGYTAGRTGRVFEVNEKRGRVRVEWNGCPRTWVRLASVAIVESNPRTVCEHCAGIGELAGITCHVCHGDGNA